MGEAVPDPAQLPDERLAIPGRDRPKRALRIWLITSELENGLVWRNPTQALEAAG
jgi:hypothetical protein